MWSARNRARKPGIACFDFFRERRRVGAYYFYILAPEFGLGFIRSEKHRQEQPKERPPPTTTSLAPRFLTRQRRPRRLSGGGSLIDRVSS